MASTENSSRGAELGIMSTEPLNVLLAQTRSELMYELRRISHKNKPVSRHAQRDLLEAFLQRRGLTKGCAAAQAMASKVKSKAEASSRSCAESKDVKVADEQSYRPDSIVLEVRGLFEQRPVSRLLQSTFRPSLERALHQSERQRRRRLRPTPIPRRRGAQTMHPRLPRSRSPRNDRANDTQARVEQAQREEILLELSELLQHQVVSQVLSGEFHGVLELHLQDRLQRSGANGQRVQQFVQSLSGRRSARDMPAVGGGSYGELVQKVNTMHNELEELRRLVRLSFDLQLDVQRSLRQQLAAIASAVVQPCSIMQASSLDTTQRASTGTPQAVSRGTCVVCSTEQCDTVFYSCGHLCVCSCCALDLRNGPSPICPICRAPINDVIRVYEV